MHANSFLAILLVLPKYTSFFFQIESESGETDNNSSGTNTVIIMYSSTVTSYKYCSHIIDFLVSSYLAVSF